MSGRENCRCKNRVDSGRLNGNWGYSLTKNLLNWLVWVDTLTIVAATLASIGVAALTFLLSVSVVVLLTANSTIVLLALVGGT